MLNPELCAHVALLYRMQGKFKSLSLIQKKQSAPCNIASGRKGEDKIRIESCDKEERNVPEEIPLMELVFKTKQ
jgi:hypothetical protein